jgi:lysophospholipase L1-like esterase
VPASQLAPIPAGAVGWVFVGDSRAAQWPAPAIEGLVVRNLGISGQTTAQVAARLTFQVLPLHPQWVLLQVGVNDLKAIPLFPERAREIVDATRSRIDSMVETLRANGAAVLLTTIFPTAEIPLLRQFLWSAEADAAIVEVNRHIASRAGPGVVVFDAAAVLRGPDGRIRPAYARDFLHINDAGYTALNEALLGKLPARLPL